MSLIALPGRLPVSHSCRAFTLCLESGFLQHREIRVLTGVAPHLHEAVKGYFVGIAFCYLRETGSLGFRNTATREATKTLIAAAREQNLLTHFSPIWVTYLEAVDMLLNFSKYQSFTFVLQSKTLVKAWENINRIADKMGVDSHRKMMTVLMTLAPKIDYACEVAWIALLDQWSIYENSSEQIKLRNLGLSLSGTCQGLVLVKALDYQSEVIEKVIKKILDNNECWYKDKLPILYRELALMVAIERKLFGMIELLVNAQKISVTAERVALEKASDLGLSSIVALLIDKRIIRHHPND